MSLFSVKSETALRSRLFSSSRSFRRFTCSVFSPPNSWRHPDNTSPRSPRSGGLHPPCSGPARPEHRPAAVSQRSLQACIKRHTSSRTTSMGGGSRAPSGLNPSPVQCGGGPIAHPWRPRQRNCRPWQRRTNVWRKVTNPGRGRSDQGAVRSEVRCRVSQTQHGSVIAQ